MQCPGWWCVLAVLCVSTSEVGGQCWDDARCKEFVSEENVLECIRLCRSDLTAESAAPPGDGHLQPPSADEQGSPALPPAVSSLSPVSEEAREAGAAQNKEKRSYSMEHFRWGKPVGRKRRPIKVYTNGVEEKSVKALPTEIRRQLAVELEDYPQEDCALPQQDKKDGSYRMKHFRWSDPPASKRYGGFMKSWDERGQKPLLTLFKNVINKDGREKKDQ